MATKVMPCDCLGCNEAKQGAEMLLTLKDGKVFMVHFHHEKSAEKLWDHTTTCTIHAGLCTNKTRPCLTDGSVTGVARSSRKDKFNKAEGRKLALSRAMLASIKKAERAELWAEYLKLYPPSPHQKRGYLYGNQTE